MKIAVCPVCKGDGFWRIPKASARPELNVARARLIREPVPPTGDAILDYYLSIVAYEYDCYRCHGADHPRG